MKGFFERFRNPDGSLRGGFTEYDTPQELRDRLRTDLRAIVSAGSRPEVPRGGHEARVTVPPYAEIARALRAGRVIPVIGPGVVAV